MLLLFYFSQLVNNDQHTAPVLERILPAAERVVRFCLVTLCGLRAEREQSGLQDKHSSVNSGRFGNVVETLKKKELNKQYKIQAKMHEAGLLPVIHRDTLRS